MTPEIERVRVALAGLDMAAKAEGIEPDSYLGQWTATQRELVQALYGLEAVRASQLQRLVDHSGDVVAKAERAVAEAAKAAQMEIRKIDRALEQARITLGEKESETVQALVDAFATRMHDFQVIRAKAWSQTRYLQTAAVLAAAGLLLVLASVWMGRTVLGNGAPSDFLAQCVASLQRDQATGKTFCAVQVSQR